MRRSEVAEQSCHSDIAGRVSESAELRRGDGGWGGGLSSLSGSGSRYVKSKNNFARTFSLLSISAARPTMVAVEGAVPLMRDTTSAFWHVTSEGARSNSLGEGLGDISIPDEIETPPATMRGVTEFRENEAGQTSARTLAGRRRSGVRSFPAGTTMTTPN